MARIPAEEIERLKREVSLERLAEARGIRLQRHGADLLGLCPFHEDHEPSLVITPAKNLWHCLGACQAGGSVIDWVMRAEGVSFRHAVELLREDLPVAASSSARPVKVSTVPKLPRLLARDAEDEQLLRQVVRFYHETLKESPEALGYLEKRGLRSAEAIERFQLGFANRTLAYRLPAKNRKEGEAIRTQLQRLGILRESGHEHLNGSLVVPVFDEEGRVTELYGRKVTPNPRPGTPLHLYLPGPHRGVWNVEVLQAHKEVILCEALLDALTFWCAGFRNVTPDDREARSSSIDSGTRVLGSIPRSAPPCGRAASASLAPRAGTLPGRRHDAPQRTRSAPAPGRARRARGGHRCRDPWPVFQNSWDWPDVPTSRDSTHARHRNDHEANRPSPRDPGDGRAPHGGGGLTCLVALEAGTPRGVVTDRDIIFAVLCDGLEPAAPVAALTWRPLVMLEDNERADEAFRLMETHGLRHLPVMGSAGQIVGRVAVEDALALLLDDLMDLARCARADATVRLGGAALRAGDTQLVLPTVDGGASVRSLATRLRRTGADALVVRERVRPAGVVSEHDLLSVVAGRRDADLARARDLVRRPFVTVDPRAPLEDVVALMAPHGVDQVAVAHAARTLGVVSLEGLLTALAFEFVERLGQALTPGREPSARPWSFVH